MSNNFIPFFLSPSKNSFKTRINHRQTVFICLLNVITQSRFLYSALKKPNCLIECVYFIVYIYQVDQHQNPTVCFINKTQRGMQDYFNKSSIDFTKFTVPAQNPQKDKIYTYESEVSTNLKQREDFTSIKTKFYRNNIFHSAHKYQVPVYQQPKKRPDTAYHQFYRTHHKFTKPYGEHTKYLDNLNKNKTILRRCNFNLPVNTLDIHSNPTNSKLNTTTNTKKYRRTQSRYQKHQLIFSPPKQNNAFDKTIKNQYTVFRKLFDKQRNNRTEKIQLDNSMNRILASEMINLRINNCIAKSKTIQT